MALGWHDLVALGSGIPATSLASADMGLSGSLSGLPSATPKDRLRQMALQLPINFGTGFQPALAAR